MLLSDYASRGPCPEGAESLDVAGLKTRFLELFGEAAPSRHRQSLVRRTAWMPQALRRGRSVARMAVVGILWPLCYDGADPDVSHPVREQLSNKSDDDPETDRDFGPSLGY
jgi:hypothetical protein